MLDELLFQILLLCYCVAFIFSWRFGGKDSYAPVRGPWVGHSFKFGAPGMVDTSGNETNPGVCITEMQEPTFSPHDTR
jgi:hypothetical protein